MRTTSIVASFGLMALAAAAPADVVRRQADIVADSTTDVMYPTTIASTFPTYNPIATGIFPPSPSGTGTAAPPAGTDVGTPCSNNGGLVCSDDGTMFGLCNWGRVVFRPVADGTKCEDGKIEFLDGYNGPMPTGGHWGGRGGRGGRGRGPYSPVETAVVE